MTVSRSRVSTGAGDFVSTTEKPAGVPGESGLPINRERMDLEIIMRLYAADLERYES
jgi:hypothetical protein